MESFEFVTDTATMCVFDPVALRHRLDDDADWWSIERDEILEMNQGNVVFIDLGTDGKFAVKIGEIEDKEQSVGCNIKCPSGRIFAGSGEEVTSDGCEPEGLRGGIFLIREPGNYRVEVARRSQNGITLYIKKTSEASNNFDALLRI